MPLQFDHYIQNPTTSKFRFGIVGRATILILLLVCFCFAACSAYIYRSQSALIRDEVAANMSKLSAASARSIGNWLRGKIDVTQVLAQNVAVIGAGPMADGVLVVKI